MPERSNNPSPPALLTIADAAAYLGVHTRTVRRRIEDGTLTAYRVGPRLIRLHADQVAAVGRPVPNALSVA